MLGAPLVTLAGVAMIVARLLLWRTGPLGFEGGYYGGPVEGRRRVHDRDSRRCMACGATARRLTHAGRSTFFCPRRRRR